ncbi:MAG TPA: SWIM zinc finger family protein [Chitinophagales bacterium]|nr:SWIM zinc finger family protein [Chitinophagales bacterium]
MTFSEEQVIALAPDAGSVKSGKDLATASKWGLLCVSDKALWGECQGSGKLPYQAQVDLNNLAFKCSCPSRKFPCKHGLALLLLYVRDATRFSRSAEPEWVTQWIDKRAEKVEKKSEQKEKPVDAEAQAKRSEARARKIADGIDDLQVWLKDLVRNGLLSVPERAYDFWQTPSKRMIDAQAPGLAAMLRGLGKINYYGADWQYELLSKLTRIYLATEAYKQLNSLPQDWVEEVKSLIGFTQSKEELLAQPGVRDTWQVLSRTYVEEEQITIERNWLYGTNTGRYALILQFIAKAQVPELNLMPGTSVDAELVFYKGVNPLRALMKTQHSVGPFSITGVYNDFNAALQALSDSVSQNPFLDSVPVLMNNVSFYKQGSDCYLVDEKGECIKVRSHQPRDLYLLSITGGMPFNMFLQASETEFEPLSLWADKKYYVI